MQKNVPHWDKRVWEYRLMLDDDFAYAMNDAGVTLTDYAYIRKHGRASRIGSAFSLVKEVLRRN